MVKILLVLMLVIGGLFALDNGVYKINRVVDGDTVTILQNDKEVKIRLAFIDTLESAKNTRAKNMSIKCKIDIEDIIEDGLKSKAFLKQLILDKEVNIIFYGIDDTGTRMVGEIFFIDDPESINIKMIKEGYAMPYIYYIKKFKKDVNYYKSIAIGNENEITSDTCVRNLLGY